MLFCNYCEQTTDEHKTEEEKTEENLETSESEFVNSTSTNYLFDDTPSYSLWEGICENPF